MVTATTRRPHDDRAARHQDRQRQPRPALRRRGHLVAGVLVDHQGRAREELRRAARARPITWQPPIEDSLIDEPEDFGYWAITTHRHLVEVTRRTDDFLSGPGILMESAPAELVEAAQSIIAMDPPRHSKMRRLVAAAFTPKQMRRIKDQIEANARKVVDNLVEKASSRRGVGRVRRRVRRAAADAQHQRHDGRAGRRPAGGQPRDDAVHLVERPRAGRATRRRSASARMFQAIVSTCTSSASASIDERRDEPAGRTCSPRWCRPRSTAKSLTDDEIGSFFCLLTIAGNDTTRQSTEPRPARPDHAPRPARLADGGPDGPDARPPSRRSCAGRPRS